MRRWPMHLYLLLIAGTIVVTTAKARACACCAEPGTWFEETVVVYGVMKQHLNSVQFGPQAMLREHNNGRNLRADALSYEIKYTMNDDQWRLNFTDGEGNKGTLAFNMPKQIKYFGVDLRDGQQAGGGGPQIYKEWRLSGRVWGNGVFASQMGGTPTFHLVLQGRGNHCDSPTDWRNWRLSVEGPHIDVTFFGDLEPASAAASNALYFASPQAAIPIITQLLRDEDWSALSRYYNLGGADIPRSELESGRFFIHTQRPEAAHPAGFWRYKHPFAPGFTLSGVRPTGDANISLVEMTIEIDQGGGVTQRGRSEFLMIKSEHGYQILPPSDS